jgi:hypothetical protein
MTPDEFKDLGKKITSCKRGYQMPLALKLGISLRQVQYYASGKSTVTKTIELLMMELSK